MQEDEGSTSNSAPDAAITTTDQPVVPTTTAVNAPLLERVSTNMSLQQDEPNTTFSSTDNQTLTLEQQVQQANISMNSQREELAAARKVNEDQAIALAALRLQGNQLQEVNDKFTKYVKDALKFNGDPEELDVWKRDVERHITNFETHSPLSTYAKLDYAKSKLTGPAAKWLFATEKNPSVSLITFKDLLKELELRFGEKNKEDRAFRYQMGLQPVNKDMVKYEGVFTKHMQNSDPIGQLYAIRYFKEGLHIDILSRMKVMLLRNDNPTLQEVQLMAHTAQREYETETQQVAGQVAPLSPKRKAEGPSYLSKRPNTADSLSSTCTNCGYPGHAAKDCRTDIRKKCSYCGKLGHEATSCRKDSKGRTYQA